MPRDRLGPQAARQVLVYNGYYYTWMPAELLENADDAKVMEPSDRYITCEHCGGDVNVVDEQEE